MFTILSPNDTPVKQGSTEIKDNRFGGLRAVSEVSDEKDYTKRTGTNQSAQENPVDTTIKDVDDLANETIRKNEFTYQEELSNCQLGNSAEFISQSENDFLPTEDSRDFEPDILDPNFKVKRRGSKVPSNFGASSPYDELPNKGFESSLR